MSTLKGAPVGNGFAQEVWIKGCQGQPYRTNRIESLPDDVLILIFRFYLDQAQDEELLPAERAEEWHALVHVCRRWRSVVFASPRHLHLRLVCTGRRSVGEMNNIWPAALPIVIRVSDYPPNRGEEYTHNIITALEHKDRVSEISFCEVSDLASKSFVAVMKEPFPLLTSLSVLSWHGTMMPLPDFFMGGSAPHLRSLRLDRVKFPALRTLLSSTNDLDKLSLHIATGSAYILPDAMVSCLSAVTRLKSLQLLVDCGFAPSHRNREGPTRIVLPALTHLSWTGNSVYLNELLALIDAPQLYSMTMTFYGQFVLEAPQVALFIGRTERFKEPYRANMAILSRTAELILLLRTQTVHYPPLELAVKYPLRCLSSVVQTCRSSFLPLSTVKRLDIDGIRLQPQLGENAEWLRLLDLFVAVEDLCVSKKLALHVALALQELSVERATEVLPALHNLFIEGLEPLGPVQEAIEQFVATRQLTGHPVAVRPWTA